MTVKEILLAAAGELGMLEDVQAYLDGESPVGEADTENLLRCFNLVENELALDFLPLLAEETVETAAGVLYFSELSRAAVRIVRVTDKWGNELEYKLCPEYVKTQPGEVTVRYTYTPQTKSIGDESDYKAFASVRLFAYGIAAEYTLASGSFEESAVWEKKYKDALAAAYRAQPRARMKARRWV